MNNKKQPTIPVAVFDISSASVGGAHAFVRKYAPEDTQKVSLISQFRQNSDFHEDINTERFISETTKNLKTVAQKLFSENKIHPKYIQIVLASPWYNSQTRNISYKKSTEFVCNENLINDLVSKEIEHILVHEKEKFGNLGTNYTIVEKQISSIRLNGYAIEKPYGKSARSVELSLTITIAPKAIIEAFKTAIESVYAIKKIGITTSPYTTFIAMRENSSIDNSCVLVDIGEEITDVAFVKDDVFLYQHSFPIGTNALPRSVSKKGNFSISEVKSILEAYRLDTLNLKNKKSIEQGISVFIKDWEKEIEKIVDTDYFGFILPKSWFVVVDPKFEFLIKNSLSNNNFIKHKTITIPNIDVVTQDELYSISKPIDIELDVPITLALLFVEKIL